MDVQERMPEGHIFYPGAKYIMYDSMMEYAGKTAKIIIRHPTHYDLNIDNRRNCWEDWMFDPDYRPDEPLSAIDAVIAMARDRQVLYNKDGEKYWFDHGEDQFLSAKTDSTPGRPVNTFTGLSRRPEKRKRLMANDEARAWAKSEESHGWMVRCDEGEEHWSFPNSFGYGFFIGHYRRAKMLPDGSGIDESTIQGFEVEA
jgi:hypothetical protein